MSFAELRVEHQNALKREKGKILPFENFKLKVDSMGKLFQTKKEGNELPLYSIDSGFLQLVLAEKEGIEMAKYKKTNL